MRFITSMLYILGIAAVVLLCMAALSAEPMHPGDLAIQSAPPSVFNVDANGVMHPKPLSAIAVSQCGGALALFIQIDANHLLRADPRQSDLFTNVDGKMQQSTIGPLEWGIAYSVAQQAAITTHVVVPCDSKEATT